MSLVTVQPTSGTNQNNGDSFYGWMGWKITMGAAPVKLMQVHSTPIYVTPPGKFAIFDRCPTDYLDDVWLQADDFWEDDSENYFADVAGGAGYVLSASTTYYLCVRAPDQITAMDFPFWDETGLLPVATTGGYFTLDAAILENGIPSPVNSWPFPGSIYEVTIETDVGGSVPLRMLMGMGL